MLYAVLFEDDPAVAAEARRTHMAAHLAFLDEQAGRIRAAGPLATAEGQVPGGLWLVEAESFETVEALVRADPFWPTGLRRSVTIRAWRQVFADGRRL
jgi:uncharacterized protein YciI